MRIGIWYRHVCAHKTHAYTPIHTCAHTQKNPNITFHGCQVPVVPEHYIPVLARVAWALSQ